VSTHIYGLKEPEKVEGEESQIKEKEQEKSEKYFEDTYLPTIAKTALKNDRMDGLRIVVGQDIIELLG